MQLPISLGCIIDSCGPLEDGQIDEEDRTWDLPWRTRHCLFVEGNSALNSYVHYHADTREVWRVRLQNPMHGRTFRFGEIVLSDSLSDFVSRLGEPARAFQIAHSVRAHFWFEGDVVYAVEALTATESMTGNEPGAVQHFQASSSSRAPIGHETENDPLNSPCFLNTTRTVEEVARLLAERLGMSKVEMSVVFHQPYASLSTSDGEQRLAIQAFRDSSIVEIEIGRGQHRLKLAAAVRANAADLGTVL